LPRPVLYSPSLFAGIPKRAPSHFAEAKHHVDN